DVLDKPMIFVFNKIDKVDIHDILYDIKLVGTKIFVSAKNNVNLDKLMAMIEEHLPQQYFNVKLNIPYDKQSIVNYLMSNYEVEEISYVEAGTIIKVVLNQIDYERYKIYII